MKEFVSFAVFCGGEKERIAQAMEEAGLCEVYETWWTDLGNYHTDYVGDYRGEDLSVIPENAEVRWTVMDAEEYDNTLLANCDGKAEDYVCEDTGKVLVVQFYVPQED